MRKLYFTPLPIIRDIQRKTNCFFALDIFDTELYPVYNVYKELKKDLTLRSTNANLYLYEKLSIK
jgi:hypothetical protein